jgi:hypothetical protein
MKISFNPEICCEFCNEIIHNHMDKCPACQTNWAATSIYSRFSDHWDANVIPRFSCEECNTNFKALKTFKEIEAHEGIYYTEWEIVT